VLNYESAAASTFYTADEAHQYQGCIRGFHIALAVATRSWSPMNAIAEQSIPSVHRIETLSANRLNGTFSSVAT
jgi:hypothetical protein